MNEDHTSGYVTKNEGHGMPAESNWNDRQQHMIEQRASTKLKSTTTLSTIKKVAVAFLIGRFQPFHNGHKHLIDYGLKYADKVVVLVGSSNKARSVTNPWTYEERKAMIQDTYIQEFNDGKRESPFCVEVEPLPDVPGNDDAWLGNVSGAVHKHNPGNDTIGVIGFKKDDSSYYLDLFVDAEKILLDEGFATLSATEIRDAYFQRAPHFPQHLVPDVVMTHLLQFYTTEDFRYVLEEKEWLDAYKKSWANSPFPPQFVTCDAVCTQMGQVLLVTRGGFPGKGQLALPGGFVEAHKGDSFQNVLYELWEEAGIQDERGRIPRGKLEGFYTGKEQRFDDPSRSVRGYTLTTAFRFKFPKGKKLFSVKGGDDAIDAQWYDISYIKANPHLLFEDHYSILMEML
jgi:bifunctional NMN adenylyltransferase/nudix hydrolase